jgi:cell wall assembly regulator SMI1
VTVENTIKNTWSLFKDTIKAFLQLANDLKTGCQQSDITAIEKKMGNVLPDALKKLYVLNNGQRVETDGIFKAISGYSKFSKVFFLTLDKMLAVW